MMCAVLVLVLDVCVSFVLYLYLLLLYIFHMIDTLLCATLCRYIFQCRLGTLNSRVHDINSSSSC